MIQRPAAINPAAGFLFAERELVSEMVKNFGNAAAAVKARRAQEASQGMKDYEAEQRAIRGKTERLRAERLAREANNPTKNKTNKKTKQQSI